MAAARLSHSLLDPYLTTPIRQYYPALHLPLRLPPEAIVLTGHTCAIAAALSLAFMPQLWWLGIVAGLFVAGHHLCDIFDGQHARATNQCRHGGELLDHFLDPLSISYLIVGWAFAAGQPLWAMPGVVVVMATAVLTNIKAKLGGTFELPRFGPTEFKTFMAVLPIAAGVGMLWQAELTATILGWTLLTLTALSIIKLPFDVIAAVRSVNRSKSEVDTTEWVNAA